MRATSATLVAALLFALTSGAEDSVCPTMEGHWKPPGTIEEPPVEACDVAVFGRLAIVADATYYSGRLRVLDASDPQHLIELGRIDLPADPTSVAMASGLVAVTHSTVVWDQCDDGGLTLVNLDNPRRPRILSTVFFRRYSCVHSATPYRDVVYVVDKGDFVTVDASDPTAALEVARFEPGPRWVNDLAVSGELLWVAGDDGRLCTADISVPTAPGEPDCATVLDPGLDLVDFSLLGDLAAVIVRTASSAQDNDFLLLLDIGQPSNPRPLSMTELEGEARNVELTGRLAVVGVSAIGGIRILDISDPAQPVEVGRSQSSPLWMERVSVAGNRLWLAAGGEGVYLLRLDSCHPLRNATGRRVP